MSWRERNEGYFLNAKQCKEFFVKNLSLTRQMILKDLKIFSDLIGNTRFTIDVGSGRELRYKDVFKSSKIFGLDLYAPSHIRADALALPFPSHCIDTVICTEVLEHLENANKALLEIRRILTDGGYLIITVPFLLGIHDTVDYHRWTESGLKHMLMDAGFTLVSLRKRGGIFSAIGNLISHIPRQVFGELVQNRSWVIKSLYALVLLPSLVVPWMMSPFDILDRQKRFVVGYSVLCQR